MAGPSPQRSDPYAAYCLDEAVWMFGEYVEGEIDKASRKAKNTKQAESFVRQKLAYIFRDDSPEEEKKENSTAGKFADPAARFHK